MKLRDRSFSHEGTFEMVRFGKHLEMCIIEENNYHEIDKALDFGGKYILRNLACRIFKE